MSSVIYHQDVLVYGFFSLVVLVLARLIVRRRWVSIVTVASLMTPLTLLFIEALFRDPNKHGRYFFMWPFPFPNLGPNLLFWFLLWLGAAFFWVPRRAQRPPHTP